MTLPPNPLPPRAAGKIIRVPTGLMHGKQSKVFHDADDKGGLLETMPKCAATPALCHRRSTAPPPHFSPVFTHLPPPPSRRS